MVLGVVLYFTYGRRHSRFSTPGGREDAAAANAARRA
jgi:APA family basic amino acid/polyamine antiporter